MSHAKKSLIIKAADHVVATAVLVASRDAQAVLVHRVLLLARMDSAALCVRGPTSLISNYTESCRPTMAQRATQVDHMAAVAPSMGKLPFAARSLFVSVINRTIP